MRDYISVISKYSKYIVTVNPIFVPKSESSTSYEDARSAAFYAMGLALKEKKPVFLMVPGEYVANTLTAITEAWFQKANVIVIAFFDRISDVKTAWADRCVINTMTVGADEYECIEQFMDSSCGGHGPALLNIIGNISKTERCDYSAIFGYLTERSVMAYNSLQYSSDNIKNIDKRYKYGLISKYIGMSSVKDCGVLVCSAEAVLVDVNIFRTRYANANMKIVIMDDGSIMANGIDQWITSNGWLCKVTRNCEETAWLLDQNKQAVLIIEEA